MLFSRLLKKFKPGVCGEKSQLHSGDLAKVILAGSPNVGKSALFNRLTGRYVTVSNYPGTTVEVSRGRSKAHGGKYEVVDTPGMYLLSAITEEERVARSVLMTEKPSAVIQLVDAKNIERMLGLTLQLIEAGLPVILALNMADEARDLGIKIDVNRLSQLLGIPVIETVATSGEGIAKLTSAIEVICQNPPDPISAGEVDYGPELQGHISSVAAGLDKANGISARAKAVLLLQEDPDEVSQLVRRLGKAQSEAVLATISAARGELDHSVHYLSMLAIKRNVEKLLVQVASFPINGPINFRERLSRLCIHPVTGIPLLLVVLYFGLYKFVGGFGAGTMVDFIETDIFEGRINPWIEGLFNTHVPWKMVQDLFVGKY